VISLDDKVKKSEPWTVAKRVKPFDSETRSAYRYIYENQRYRQRHELREAAHEGRKELIKDSYEHRSDRIYGKGFRERRRRDSGFRMATTFIIMTV